MVALQQGAPAVGTVTELFGAFSPLRIDKGCTKT